jgi:hyperosmotically inducible protein
MKTSIAVAILWLCAFTVCCQQTSRDDLNPPAKADSAANPDSSPNTTESKQAVSDNLITMEANLALIGSVSTSGYQIDASTQDGIVTLSGKMDKREIAEGAVNLVRAIKGVRSVSNRIQIDPEAKRGETTASDDQIDNEVKGILSADPNLQHLSARGKAGQIMLIGSIDTHQRLLSTAEAIRKLDGVRFVYTKQVDIRSEQ